MRHHNRNRKLNRVKRQRVALLRSLARSFILDDGITTTVAKAKELRPFVERLVTETKRGTLASFRGVMVQLCNSAEAGKKLKETTTTRFTGRSGGYTRIVKLGRIGKRVGEMARIEFVQ